MKLCHLPVYLLRSRCLLFYFLLLIGAAASAQLCQGSLGDPIVNIDFGSGSNPGPAVAAAQGLQYTTSTCPNDGFYTTCNGTSSCFGSTWHSLSDHTAPGRGYLMLINGSYQPSVFYLDTVKSLCSGTTYEFAAWLMNVQKPTSCNGNIILPDVTFSIEKADGTIIQSYNTGNIAATSSPIWRQFGFYFNTPTGISDVVLRIRNNAPGGCGNDIGLDDITFRPCGPRVVAGIAGIANDTINVCQGTIQNFQLVAQVSGNTATNAYQWQRRSSGGAWADIAGATGTSYNAAVNAATPPAVYEYRLATADASNIGSANCRIYSKILSLIVAATPAVTIAPGGTPCTGKPFLLKASGGSMYTWIGPNGFSSTDSTLSFANLQSTMNGIYTVTVSNNAGCTATQSFTLTTLPSVRVFTSFTDTAICQKTPVQLIASGGETYQWSPATSLSNTTIAGPVATAADTTRYRVIAANTYGCTDTGYIQVNAIKKVIAFAGPDKVVVSNQGVVLEGSIQNQYSNFYWSPAAGLSDARLLQPQVVTQTDALYFLTAISPGNCGISTDTVNVKVYQDIFIPSAFTPNGDGKNDVWNIPSLQAFPQYELLVYNRYGQLVFQSKNGYQPWSGKMNGSLLPAGTYVYWLNIPDLKRTWKGTVLIIR